MSTHYIVVVDGKSYSYYNAPISEVLYVDDDRLAWHLSDLDSGFYLGHFRTLRELRQHIGSLQ